MSPGRACSTQWVLIMMFGVLVMHLPSSYADFQAYICPQPPCSGPFAVTQDYISSSVWVFSQNSVAARVDDDPQRYKEYMVTTVAVADAFSSEVRPVSLYGRGYMFYWSSLHNRLYRLNTFTSQFAQVPLAFPDVSATGVAVTALCAHYNIPGYVFVMTNSSEIGTFVVHASTMTLNSTTANMWGSDCVEMPMAETVPRFATYSGRNVMFYTPSVDAAPEVHELPERIVSLAERATVVSTVAALYYQKQDDSGNTYFPRLPAQQVNFTYACAAAGRMSIWGLADGVLYELYPNGTVYSIFRPLNATAKMVYASCNWLTNMLYAVDDALNLYSYGIQPRMEPSPPRNPRIVSYSTDSAVFTCDDCNTPFGGPPLLYLSPAGTSSQEVLMFEGLTASNLPAFTRFSARMSWEDGSVASSQEMVFGTAQQISMPSNLQLQLVQNGTAFDFVFSWDEPAVRFNQHIDHYVLAFTDVNIQYSFTISTTANSTSYRVLNRQLIGDHLKYTVAVAAVSQEFTNVGLFSDTLTFVLQMIGAPTDFGVYPTLLANNGTSAIVYVFEWNAPTLGTSQAIGYYHIEVTDTATGDFRVYSTPDDSTAFVISHEAFFGDFQLYSATVAAVELGTGLLGGFSNRYYFNASDVDRPPRPGSSDGGSGLSTAAVIGVVVGSIAAVAIACAAVMFIVRRRKPATSREEQRPLFTTAYA
eukprot:ANDGO_01238.mRNA.1 hypothetical protein